MGRVVGIDLGTSTSAVSVLGEDGKTYVIPDSKGLTIQPSVVSFNEDGTYVVGQEAKARSIIYPESTVYSSKRLIGRKFFSSEVKKAQAICSYNIVEGPDDGVRISVRGQDYSLPEIGSFILKKMKRIAEEHLGEEVDQAVITVPAYFNDGQRQATKDAGIIAGLKVLRIINEPTAAALAYGFGKGLDQKVAIYDLGGGTFDVSILEIGDDIYEVISTSGDTYLGGDDFDDRLVDYLAEAFLKQHDIDVRSDKSALQKLKIAAEDAKIALTTETETEVIVAGIADGVNGPLDLQASVTRTYFAKLTHDMIQRTFKVCDEALQAASMTVNDIDGLILVGGSTKMVIIQEAVRAYFGREPQANINPEEVVAIGAGILGSALVESAEGSLLLDVTPMSLGIATAGGIMDVLIPNNSPVPTEQSRIFTTARDNQTSVAIRIFQGEGRKWAENEPLGEFKLTGLPPGPMGAHKISVTFEIDADGIVDVSAIDKGTGREQSVTLQVSGGLSKEEVEQLKAQHDSDQEVTSA